VGPLVYLVKGRNQMKTPTFAALAVLLTGAAVMGQNLGNHPNTISFDPAKGSPKATLAEASWLTGRWTGVGLGGETEELWLQSKAGSMLCTFRLINDNQVVFYEIVTITEENGSLTLNIKHFHPDLKGWEDRDKVLRFPLVKVTATELFFDDLTYRKIDDHEMEVFVLIHKKSGEVVEERFPYHRAVGL
jgi:hypothetical protein